MNPKDLPTVTVKDILTVIEKNLKSLAPMDATEYLQELIHELSYYSLGITRGVIAPMTRAGNTDMLLVAPQERLAIIVPDKRIIT
jgi:hypothetical protein